MTDEIFNSAKHENENLRCTKVTCRLSSEKAKFP